MSTQNNNPLEQNNQQQTTGQERSANDQKSSEISLPKIDRPEGPFEHSGETSRWTEEERQEKTDEAQQSGNKKQE